MLSLMCTSGKSMRVGSGLSKIAAFTPQTTVTIRESCDCQQLSVPSAAIFEPISQTKAYRKIHAIKSVMI